MCKRDEDESETLHVANGAQLVRLAALHARPEKMKFAGHVEYKRAVSGRRENWVKSWDQQCEAKHAVRVGGGGRGAHGAAVVRDYRIVTQSQRFFFTLARILGGGIVICCSNSVDKSGKTPVIS